MLKKMLFFGLAGAAFSWLLLLLRGVKIRPADPNSTVSVAARSDGLQTVLQSVVLTLGMVLGFSGLVGQRTLGWPALALSLLAGVGCLYAFRRRNIQRQMSGPHRAEGLHGKS